MRTAEGQRFETNLGQNKRARRLPRPTDNRPLLDVVYRTVRVIVSVVFDIEPSVAVTVRG